jgi:hypothetical protein
VEKPYVTDKNKNAAYRLSFSYALFNKIPEFKYGLPSRACICGGQLVF